MAQSFTAQVDASLEKSWQTLEAVFKQSAQDVFSTAQTPVAQGGNMPVRTSTLRNSLISGLNGSTSMTGPDSYALSIIGAKLGDTVFGGWTAEYALHVEYGSQGRPGRRFMGQAAAQWQAIVARNAAKVR
jgi:hypothetical protein